MNKILLAGLVFVGIVSAAWYALRPPDLSALAATPAAPPVASGSTARESANAPAIAPPLATSSVRPPPQAVSRPLIPTVSLKSALAIEFENAKNLKTVYDRYAANPAAADPETKFFAALAIESCQSRARGPQAPAARGVQPQATGPGSDQDRERFLARLKENDPNNTARTEAYNRVVELCAGFSSLNVTAADASRLFREAALAGNPAAKASYAADLFREQSRGARNVEERRMTEEQLTLVRDALSSGDPFAIRRAGTLLSWESAQLADRRIGPEGDVFNARDFAQAWALAACDKGANCGPDSLRLLNGCANQGYCGYQNLETYLQFNELPPSGFTQAQNFRNTIATAITQGRWDWLGIAAGSGRTVAPTPPAATQRPRPPGG